MIYLLLMYGLLYENIDDFYNVPFSFEKDGKPYFEKR